MQNFITLNFTAPDPDYNTIISLTPTAKASMLPMLLVFAEIEILQGQTNHLVDGTTEYKFNLSEEKLATLQSAFRHAMGIPQPGFN